MKKNCKDKRSWPFGDVEAFLLIAIAFPIFLAMQDQ